MEAPNFRSKDRKLFIDYVPQEILDDMDSETVKHLYKYRDYHRFIHDRTVKIEMLEERIKKYKKDIESHKSVIDGEGGFKEKLMFHYQFVTDYDKQLRINSWMEKKPRSSKSFKLLKGDSIKIDSSFSARNTHKGKPLKETIDYITKVEIPERRRKTIYCGQIPDIVDQLQRLGVLKNKEVNQISIDDIKPEVKVIVNQFSRFHIYKKGWDDFRNESGINLTKVVDWCIEMDNKTPNEDGSSQRDNWF